MVMVLLSAVASAAPCGVLSTGDDEVDVGLLKLVEGKAACDVTVRYWPADAPADCVSTPGCLAALAAQEGLGLLVSARLTDLVGEPWLQLGVVDVEGERLLQSEVPQGPLAAMALLVARLKPAPPREQLEEELVLEIPPERAEPETPSARGALSATVGLGRWYDPGLDAELSLRSLWRSGLGALLSLGLSSTEGLQPDGPGRVRVVLPRAAAGVGLARQSGSWTGLAAVEATATLYSSRPALGVLGARLRAGADVRLAGPLALSFEGLAGATFSPIVPFADPTDPALAPALALRAGPSFSW
jgi:hypothetical protein